MLFSEKLKMLRKESKLTQEELAEKLNVSRQAITKWESNEGLPDIENLKQISIMFNTTIDELVKEDKNIDLDIKKDVYFDEIEIDHTKHFDVHINKSKEINFISNKEEKVKVEVISYETEDLNDLLKIKFDDLYNKMDIDIKNKSINDLIINIYIPEKYIDEIELKTKSKLLSINNLNINKIEADGSLKYLNVLNSKGRIVLNTTKCDVEVDYDKFDGILEVNTFNSTARVSVPKETKYKTVLKGIKNSFIDAVNTEESNNIIELNGLNSKLIVIEKI